MGERASLHWLATGALALAVTGCATGPADPRPTAPAFYAGWSCERIHDGIDQVQQRAADVAYAVDARVGNNMIALGPGVSVFWPALLAMRPDGMEGAELAELKGRYEAMHRMAERRRCGPPPGAATAALQLPVGPGDRLVYEDRGGAGGLTHELGMRVAALRRDQLEFAIDLDGRALAQPWRQDLAGNPQPPPRMPEMMGWQRLLRRDMELGQVIAGELAAPPGGPGPARVRGQVVAIGPQQVDGRAFDVAVIQLFGDAPSDDAGDTARLDGIMSVDRRSGVLLRLELRCSNVNFALRRRLLRVEPAGG